MKKLTDIVIGGVYQYRRNDNDEVVYIGSTEHIKDKWGEPLQKVDDWHRKGHTFKTKYRYSWTVFRCALRSPFGEKAKIEWLHKPEEITREALLFLEGEAIQEAQAKGHCYLNHTSDPLKSWKKFNVQES